MPLASPLNPSEDGWVECHRQALADFANKIGLCIGNSEWEMLAITLESRQAYLEKMFAEPVPENCRIEIKQLAEFILEQDKFFQAQVEEQRNLSTRLQLTLERGRRAIKAYNDQ